MIYLTIDWRGIEEKWRSRWDESEIFNTDPDPAKKKFYLTVAYPYPNSPQHIGHGRTYTLADVYARYKRMQGYNVLLPMAFHYTGTPILAMARRLEDNDKELVDTFLNIYKVPDDRMKELHDPLKMARYFHDEIKSGMIEIGYSIDWRREFTTIDAGYSRFIEWQFQKLMDKGLITRGSHPVGWCPRDGNPVGQHDTMGDVEPDIGEYTLVKFELNGYKLPTATLRPETIFGVTNIWINPDEVYAKARVNDEPWIVSRDSLKKFEHLGMHVEFESEENGSDLIGMNAENPLTERMIPLLPANFVDPKNGTGVVMSVPSHAPYDLQALEDLKHDPESMKRYGDVDLTIIEPITIISSEKYDGVPAEQVISRMGIQGQGDPRLEDATQELYSHEFNLGVMMENTGKYSGLSVRNARDTVKDFLLDEGIGNILYEIMNRPVVCRCNTETIVKIFENQWFINYGDARWKESAKECLSSMSLLPEEIRTEFLHTIDWLRGKACARKSGMGTVLPWDKDWVIESLSDSVIYMAYYTISHLIREKGIGPDQMPVQFFDFIFLGLGDVKNVSMQCKVDVSVLEDMRREFLYFYPLDSRHSGRDLVPNHLTFFIFNHSAIFPVNIWPERIVVNGSVLMGGKKMSKSFGNIIPLRDAISQHGADPLRLGIMAAAELLQDADLSLDLVRTFAERLSRFYGLAQKVSDEGDYSGKNLQLQDRWLLSRLQRTIDLTTDAMENLRVRQAIQQVIYMFDQELQWYNRRILSPPTNGFLREIVDIRVRLLAPFAPFISNEIWEVLGNRGFIALSEWPKSDPAKIDIDAEESEDLVRSVLQDIQNIINVTKIQPKKIFLYTASEWKWNTMIDALDISIRSDLTVKSLITRILDDPTMKDRAKEVSSYIQKLVIDLKQMPQNLKEKRRSIGVMKEKGILSDAVSFYKSELNVEVSIFSEGDDDIYDPKGKASFAKPYRPAIFIE